LEHLRAILLQPLSEPVLFIFTVIDKDLEFVYLLIKFPSDALEVLVEFGHLLVDPKDHLALSFIHLLSGLL
jgi:hypothetical protein